MNNSQEVNEIIDNLLLMFYNNVRMIAEKAQVKEELKKRSSSEKEDPDLIKADLLKEIQSNSYEDNLEEYKKLETNIIGYELAETAQGILPDTEESDYLMDKFKRDIYLEELGLTLEEQLEIRQDILDSFHSPNIPSNLVAALANSNQNELDKLTKSLEALATPLAKEIMDEIQKNSDLTTDLVDTVKKEISQGFAVLEEVYLDEDEVLDEIVAEIIEEEEKEEEEELEEEEIIELN